MSLELEVSCNPTRIQYTDLCFFFETSSLFNIMQGSAAGDLIRHREKICVLHVCSSAVSSRIQCTKNVAVAANFLSFSSSSAAAGGAICITKFATAAMPSTVSLICVSSSSSYLLKMASHLNAAIGGGGVFSSRVENGKTAR